MNAPNAISVSITPRIVDAETFALHEETTCTDTLGVAITTFTEQVMNLREEAVRAALIALGWTPPTKEIRAHELPRHHRQRRE